MKMDLEKELNKFGFEKLENLLIGNEHVFFYERLSDDHRRLHAIDLQVVHDSEDLLSMSIEELKNLSFDSLNILRDSHYSTYCAIKDNAIPHGLYKVGYTYHTLLSELERQEKNSSYGRFYGSILAIQHESDMYVNTSR